ncbi:MAG: hypothetical protein JO257_35310 [Deltaproteobacteria bacterium]|nr:hypothetical protein [Deltaproteobacteria bacterium]
MPATQALTILAEIENRAELEKVLAAIAADPDDNELFRPRDLPATHFTRFVIVSDEPRNELPPLLAWEVNHDGDATAYLAQVARKVRSIDRVFEHCRDYPVAGAADLDGWVAWMRARNHHATAFYTAYRGVPRSRVVNDGEVHDEIRNIIDRERTKLAGYPATEIQRRLAVELHRRRPDLDIAAEDEPSWALQWVLAILIGIPVAIVLLLILAPWAILLRHHEKTEPTRRYHRPVHDLKDMRKFEDQVTQNQLTHLVDIKPGWFRLFTVWTVLTVIDGLARFYFVNGALGGITSIHFARWVIVRDRRRIPRKHKRHRLLFFSNYDGSWESYLGEFVDRASTGLTAVWSNTVHFPRSYFLLWDGAKDEEAFKQWTRDHQIASQVWWTGVPKSTVQNVRDDVMIRRRLQRPLPDDEAMQWLEKL